ncbi:cytidine deaminase [Sphingomonas sp.]|uniref:cytidine deaminase n=1 Tax=Sphingomonas sp. TaxID=28214 RepID=UPI003B00433A
MSGSHERGGVPVADEAALIAAARAAAADAYAPYSRFPVGAAVLLRDGRIMRGVNVENASYGLSLCAETVAIAVAAAAGRMADIVAIAVAGGTGEEPLTPCGRCRQVIAEAASVGGSEVAVICATPDGGTIARFSSSSLLPHAFGAAALG